MAINDCFKSGNHLEWAYKRTTKQNINHSQAKSDKRLATKTSHIFLSYSKNGLLWHNCPGKSSTDRLSRFQCSVLKWRSPVSLSEKRDDDVSTSVCDRLVCCLSRRQLLQLAVAWIFWRERRINRWLRRSLFSTIFDVIESQRPRSLLSIKGESAARSKQFACRNECLSKLSAYYKISGWCMHFFGL